MIDRRTELKKTQGNDIDGCVWHHQGEGYGAPCVGPKCKSASLCNAKTRNRMHQRRSDKSITRRNRRRLGKRFIAKQLYDSIR